VDNTKNATIYIRGLQRGTRDAFSAACRRRGKSMTKVIKEFMSDFIAKDGKLNYGRSRKK
jgi:hypothetical protein